MTESGRTALITGGSAGIGAATVLELARRGFDVGFTYRRDADGAAHVARQARSHGVRARGCPMELASAASVKRAVDSLTAALAPIDVLVNNAGVNRRMAFLEESPEELERQLAVNLVGPFTCAREVARQMTASARHGQIINANSILARA